MLSESDVVDADQVNCALESRIPVCVGYFENCDVAVLEHICSRCYRLQMMLVLTFSYKTQNI